MNVSEPVVAAKDDFLKHSIDLDGHEMVPLHMWPEVFGEAARETVSFFQDSPLINNAGKNTLNCPDVRGDDMEINDRTVWNERGCEAPGAFDFSRRAEVLDKMGVERQLVFPSYGMCGTALLYSPHAPQAFGFEQGAPHIDALARRILKGHNDWCLKVTSELGERFRPAAFLFADTVEQMLRDADELIDGGIRAIMMPIGAPPAGMSPADARLDPLWAKLAAANVPLTLHVGTDMCFTRSSAWDRNVPAFAPKFESTEVLFQPYWGSTVHMAVENFLVTMVLGGVLERHPGLRIGVIELGAQWVGPFAERLDLWSNFFKKRMSKFLSLKPSEYINRQIRVTPFVFEDVASYFERFPHLQDVYAYSSDYPHIEGGIECKQTFLDNLAGVDETMRRKFFRDNGLFLLPD